MNPWTCREAGRELDTPRRLPQTPPPVRVIAGSLGGRKLHAPRGLATRPTSDRVKEALFMALEPLAGLKVVDLFAGSGALGIEALSRGAERVDFVESSPRARAVLERNLEDLGVADRATVWPFVLPQGLNRIRERVAIADLVLADPPYGGETARGTLEKLAGMTLLPGARVVVEHHGRDPIPARCGRLERVRERQYGETRLSTFRLASSESGAVNEENER